MGMSGKHSGTAHKVLSVLFRLGELISAIIVLAILGRFSWYIHDGSGHSSGRIIYTMVVSALAIIFSILFIVPITALFLSFPFDFIMWIMWLIAFCLLATKSGTSTCNNSWYYNYWGFYWGRFWRPGFGPVTINGPGCGEWRTVLAFSFIAMVCHLLSGILGVYVTKEYGRLKKERVSPEVEKQRQMEAAHRNDPHNGGGYANGDHQTGVNPPATAPAQATV
jgi:hypothetical protein